MSKVAGRKPTRTWTLVLAFGLPLGIVAVLAMAISYVTLIDVAKVNKIPLPVLFPIIIDVGMIGVMIVAAQLRLRGLKGSWLAYLLFAGLSVYSIMANATHAWALADMSVTSPVVAGITAAIPPTVLLGFTHLVMLLVPNERERERLQILKERQIVAQEKAAERKAVPAQNLPTEVVTSQNMGQLLKQNVQSAPLSVPALTYVEAENHEDLDVGGEEEPSREEVEELILSYMREHGKKPSGKTVGDWLGGKSVNTGNRFKQELDQKWATENSTKLVAVS